MTTYILKNTYFVKRDYETTNVVACTYEKHKPLSVDSTQWVPAGPSTLNGLTKLWIENGVTFYGYL